MLTEPRTHLAFLLHDVARAFRLRFDERARDLGVTRQQWRVLVNLAHRPGLTQTELADWLEVERITLCRMIDRLAAADLVERRADPNDRRVWRLHNTVRGEEIADRLARIGRALEAEALAGIDPDALAALTQTLTHIRAGIAAAAQPRRAIA